MCYVFRDLNEKHRKDSQPLTDENSKGTIFKFA